MGQEGVGVALLLVSLFCYGSWGPLMRFVPGDEHRSTEDALETASFINGQWVRGNARRNSHQAHMFTQLDTCTVFFVVCMMPYIYALILAQDSVALLAGLNFPLVFFAFLGGFLMSFGQIVADWSLKQHGPPLPSSTALRASLSIFVATFINFQLESNRVDNSGLLAMGVVFFLSAVVIHAQFLKQLAKRPEEPEQAEARGKAETPATEFQQPTKAAEKHPRRRRRIKLRNVFKRGSRAKNLGGKGGKGGKGGENSSQRDDTTVVSFTDFDSTNRNMDETEFESHRDETELGSQRDETEYDTQREEDDDVEKAERDSKRAVLKSPPQDSKPSALKSPPQDSKPAALKSPPQDSKPVALKSLPQEDSKPAALKSPPLSQEQDVEDGDVEDQYDGEDEDGSGSDHSSADSESDHLSADSMGGEYANENSVNDSANASLDDSLAADRTHAGLTKGGRTFGSRTFGSRTDGGNTSVADLEAVFLGMVVRRKQSCMEIIVAITTGLSFGFYSPCFVIATNDPFGWAGLKYKTMDDILLVARTNLLFAFSYWITTIVGNVLRFYLEAPDERALDNTLKDVLWYYMRKDSFTSREQWSFAAGIVYALASILHFQGGKMVGFATGELVQAFPLVSTFWYGFVLGDIRAFDLISKLGYLMMAMYILYLAAVLFYSLSGIV